ncbi:hypothetical protein M0802_011558 [Mischocyttarus mexicanus]|nr:hypothetical protein M0802_011558 [Mischocyttarus mexicanus]
MGGIEKSRCLGSTLAEVTETYYSRMLGINNLRLVQNSSELFQDCFIFWIINDTSLTLNSGVKGIIGSNNETFNT